VTGSLPYSLKSLDNFESSFKKLGKSYKSKTQREGFITVIEQAIENLTTNPYPTDSRSEPLSGIAFPSSFRFCKLVIVVAKGASGQIRLMYLVNEESKEIFLLWIYSHEMFAKRPPDKDLRNLIKTVLEVE
jgi:mRNA-degrading endonuclease RelE of RelBE toxin-antitoxin system